ncbi:hypothetical protein GOARA_067_00340 [Gordonia araii NBRC 100433]|uniref:DUF4013 domain-containing protein n=1 Tax=Gordonia araii NBRC 100433 TaxID=1073574 RepID=G7H653_9ACTN|nr:hypothetical protein [Gordonia araii]NNG98711.1 hypothetical protein [Gordonia araii NBRC 100433]GAB11292.1 hypothetical protein GOARA_067_00340 [Gordonia araii NBRC 100433]
MTQPRGGAILPGAITWSWRTLWRRPGPVLLAVLAWGAALVAIIAVSMIAAAAAGTDFEDTAETDAFSAYLGPILALPLAFLAAGCWNGLLTLADREDVRFADFFRFPSLPAQLVISVTITAVVFLADLLFGTVDGPLALFDNSNVPLVVSVVFSVLFLWSTLIAADEGATGFDALRRSTLLVVAHPLATIAVVLVIIAALILGTIVVMVGLLITMPLASLVMLYYLRRLHAAD